MGADVCDLTLSVCGSGRMRPKPKCVCERTCAGVRVGHLDMIPIAETTFLATTFAPSYNRVGARFKCRVGLGGYDERW